MLRVQKVTTDVSLHATQQVLSRRRPSVDLLARVGESFLDAGLVVVCVWGPDCERVHDVFDEVYVGDGTIERDSPMMSTWHDENLWKMLSSFLRSMGGT